MKHTEHFNLNKPEYTDPVDIQVLNENADIIDQKLYEAGGDFPAIVARLDEVEGEVVTMEGNVITLQSESEEHGTAIAQLTIASTGMASELQTVENQVYYLDTDLQDTKQKVTVNTQNISSVSQTATQLQSRVTSVEVTNIQLEGEVNTLSGDVGNLSTQVSDAVTLVSTYDTRITQNSQDITLEATRRQSADNGLSERISDNSSRITVNADNISAEVTARQHGDNELSSTISQTATAIRSEVAQKARTFYQAAVPASTEQYSLCGGDLWYCTNGKGFVEGDTAPQNPSEGDYFHYTGETTSDFTNNTWYEYTSGDWVALASRPYLNGEWYRYDSGNMVWVLTEDLALKSSLTQTADAIKAEVDSVDGRVSTLEITTTGLTTTVSKKNSTYRCQYNQLPTAYTDPPLTEGDLWYCLGGLTSDEYYIQDDIPTGTIDRNYWYETDTGIWYVYSGGQWVEYVDTQNPLYIEGVWYRYNSASAKWNLLQDVQVRDEISTIHQTEEAIETEVNRKSALYYGTVVPSNAKNGDLWHCDIKDYTDSDTPPANPQTNDVWLCTASSGSYVVNNYYEYNGSTWVLTDPPTYLYNRWYKYNSATSSWVLTEDDSIKEYATSIRQTADAITAEVREATGEHSTLKMTIDGLRQDIVNSKGTTTYDQEAVPTGTSSQPLYVGDLWHYTTQKQFYQDTAPVHPAANDYWYCTKEYPVYPPINPQNGDIYYDEANNQYKQYNSSTQQWENISAPTYTYGNWYRWNGSNWVNESPTYLNNRWYRCSAVSSGGTTGTWVLIEDDSTMEAIREATNTLSHTFESTATELNSEIQENSDSISTLNQTVNQISLTVAKKTRTYYQNTAPTGSGTGESTLANGDLWYATSGLTSDQYTRSDNPPSNPTENDFWLCTKTAGTYTSGKVYKYTSGAWAVDNTAYLKGTWYRYNGTLWDLTEDAQILDSVASLSIEQDQIIATVNTKATTYYQSGVPSNPNTSDLWYCTDTTQVIGGSTPPVDTTKKWLCSETTYVPNSDPAQLQYAAETWYTYNGSAWVSITAPTYIQGTWYRYNGSGWNETTDTSVKELASSISQKADSIQLQVAQDEKNFSTLTQRVDGIEQQVLATTKTYQNSVPPSGTTFHSGDLLYCVNNNQVIDDEQPSSTDKIWYNTNDGKWYSYSDGSWSETSAPTYISGKWYRYNGSTWDITDDISTRERVSTLATTVDGIEAEVKTKARFISSSSQPSDSGDALNSGDLWYCTDNTQVFGGNEPPVDTTKKWYCVQDIYNTAEPPVKIYSENTWYQYTSGSWTAMQTPPTYVKGKTYYCTASGTTAGGDRQITWTEVENTEESAVILNQETRLKITEQGLSSTVTEVGSISGRLDTAESNISQNAHDITLKVSETDYNGNTIASKINMTGTTIQIQAAHINLSGAVTVGDLAPSGAGTLYGVLSTGAKVEYALSTSMTVAPTGGWSTVAPAHEDGKYMWSRTTTYYLGDTATTGSPTCIAGADGQDGDNGSSSAYLTLYRRSATAPTKWTTSMTYSFTTDTLSNIPSGWSREIPADDGNTCYVSDCYILSTDNTVTITAAQWSTVKAYVSSGENGANGVSTWTLSLYQRSNSLPSTQDIPTSTYQFSTATWSINLDGTPWSKTIPTGTDPCYRTIATVESQTDTATASTNDWKEPEMFVQNGADGATGEDGNGIVSTTCGFKATSTYSQPSAGGTWESTPTATTFGATDKYLWTKETVTYTKSESTYTIYLSAVYGNTGATGPMGDTGVGVSSTVYQYTTGGYSTGSGTVAPIKPTSGSTWVEIEPAASDTYFRWRREKISWTNNNITYTIPELYEMDDRMVKWCSVNDITYMNGGSIYAHTISSEKLTTDAIKSLNYNGPTGGTTGTFSTAGSFIDLANGNWYSKHIYVDSSGGAIKSGSFTGPNTGYSTTGTKIDLKDGTIQTPNLYVDVDGSLHTKGIMEGGEIKSINYNGPTGSSATYSTAGTRINLSNGDIYAPFWYTSSDEQKLYVKSGYVGQFQTNSQGGLVLATGTTGSSSDFSLNLMVTSNGKPTGTVYQKVSLKPTGVNIEDRNTNFVNLHSTGVYFVGGSGSTGSVVSLNYSGLTVQRNQYSEYPSQEVNTYTLQTTLDGLKISDSDNNYAETTTTGIIVQDQNNNFVKVSPSGGLVHGNTGRYVSVTSTSLNVQGTTGNFSFNGPAMLSGSKFAFSTGIQAPTVNTTTASVTGTATLNIANISTLICTASSAPTAGTPGTTGQILFVIGN